MYVAELLWAITHNLPGTQTAVKEQVGDPLLTRVGKHPLEAVPALAAVLHWWFCWLSCLRQRNFSLPRRRPQHIQDDPVQTRTQVLQGSSQRVEGHPPVRGGSMPEALKGLHHIVLFALQATGCFSVGMTTQPASHHSAKAAVHPYPGLLVA